MTKSWLTFSKNYEKLLESGEGYDLSIKAGQEPDVKAFKAHSVILRTHSPYFYRALSSEWAKKEEDKMVFYKPNVTPTIFEIILKYIYTGNTEIKKEQNGEFILSLLTAADELILPEFMDEVQEYFIKHYASWIQENFYRILDFAF
ncbi:14686_t:CDS:2, partial [Acaulospora morrowiae]